MRVSQRVSRRPLQCTEALDEITKECPTLTGSAIGQANAPGFLYGVDADVDAGALRNSTAISSSVSTDPLYRRGSSRSPLDSGRHGVSTGWSLSPCPRPRRLGGVVRRLPGRVSDKWHRQLRRRSGSC